MIKPLTNEELTKLAMDFEKRVFALEQRNSVTNEKAEQIEKD